jgi:hypothetical protein
MENDAIGISDAIALILDLAAGTIGGTGREEAKQPPS